MERAKKRKPLRRREILKKGLVVLGIVSLAYFPRTRAVFAMAYNSSPEPPKYVSTDTKEEALKKLLKFYLGIGSVTAGGLLFNTIVLPLIPLMKALKVTALITPEILFIGKLLGSTFDWKAKEELKIMNFILNLATSELQIAYGKNACLVFPFALSQLHSEVLLGLDEVLEMKYCWKEYLPGEGHVALRSLTDPCLTSLMKHVYIDETKAGDATIKPLLRVLKLLIGDFSLYSGKLENNPYVSEENLSKWCTGVNQTKEEYKKIAKVSRNVFLWYFNSDPG